MENHTPLSTPNSPQPPLPPTAQPRRRIGAVVGAGLIAGLIAVGIGGVASAQSTTVVAQDPPPAQVETDDTDEAGELDGMDEEAGELDGMDEDFGDISAEDDAIFDQFDQCLTDAGLDIDALEAADALTEADETSIDNAFEQCEPILDGLSDELIVAIEEMEDEMGEFGCDDEDDVDTGDDVSDDAEQEEEDEDDGEQEDADEEADDDI